MSDELNNYHAAVTTSLAIIDGVDQVFAYPHEIPTLNKGTVQLSMTEFDPEILSDTAMKAACRFRLDISIPKSEDVSGLQLRNIAISAAIMVGKNDWGLNFCEIPIINFSGKDEFSGLTREGEDPTENWLIEYDQVLHFNEANIEEVWGNLKAIYIGLDPDIGEGNQDKYSKVENDSS